MRRMYTHPSLKIFQKTLFYWNTEKELFCLQEIIKFTTFLSYPVFDFLDTLKKCFMQPELRKCELRQVPREAF